MEKRGIQLQMLPQELLHVDMDARVDIRDGQMKGINEKLIINYKNHFVVSFFFLFLQVQNYVNGNEVDFTRIG